MDGHFNVVGMVLSPGE